MADPPVVSTDVRLSVDCIGEEGAGEVVGEASVDWLGAVDCDRFCRARFVSPNTTATLAMEGTDQEHTASAGGECGYELGGCHVADAHGVDPVTSDGEDGCWTATLPTIAWTRRLRRTQPACETGGRTTLVDPASDPAVSRS